jgi:predicted site-specific integrase-resolvase
MKKALSLRQAAALLNISHTTLLVWIKDGLGPRVFIFQNGKRKTYRIMPDDWDEFINRRSRGGK